MKKTKAISENIPKGHFDHSKRGFSFIVLLMMMMSSLGFGQEKGMHALNGSVMHIRGILIIIIKILFDRAEASHHQQHLRPRSSVGWSSSSSPAKTVQYYTGGSESFTDMCAYI